LDSSSSAVAFPEPFASFVGTSSSARGESLVGGLSHPLLDGIMHPDVRSFMPWSDSNPFLRLVGLAPLHLACVTAALFGVVCLTGWRRRGSR